MIEHQDQSDRDRSGPWRPDLLLRILLLWTSLLTSILLWLPLVRGAIEGQAYRWVFADGIGGRGMGGAYWLLVVSGVFVLSLFYFGWQSACPPFHWLLLLLHGSLAAAVLYAAINHPEELVFEGATFGARFSLVRAGPVFFGAVAGCALFWVIRDLRSHRRRSVPRWVWTRGKRVRSVLVLAMIPVQIVLLRSWGPFGSGAMIGVGLTIWQWFMITQGLLAPVKSPSAE
jgi:hypothetical protein